MLSDNAQNSLAANYQQRNSLPTNTCLFSIDGNTAYNYIIFIYLFLFSLTTLLQLHRLCGFE